MNQNNASRPRRLALIASRGTLDWAYPPFILASAAAAMDWQVAVFFTFYGLPLLKKDLSAAVTPAGNPAMPMRLPFGPEGLQKIDWSANLPNLILNNVPGIDSMATSLMKKKFKQKGVASLDELREACVDLEVRMIGCQMTMDVFGFSKDEFIDECEIGGAATFLEFAADADVSLFV